MRGWYITFSSTWSLDRFDGVQGTKTFTGLGSREKGSKEEREEEETILQRILLYRRKEGNCVVAVERCDVKKRFVCKDGRYVGKLHIG